MKIVLLSSVSQSQLTLCSLGEETWQFLGKIHIKEFHLIHHKNHLEGE